MITTFLLEHRWVPPTILLLLIALGPVVGAWLARRRTAAAALSALSLVPVLLLTLTPADRQVFERCEVAWSLPTPSRVELFANVVLMVGPVLLAAVAWRRPLVAVAAGIALSMAIETTQAFIPELGRSCSTNDWLTNSIGAVIGGVLGWLALRLANRPATREQAPGDPC